MPKDGKHRFSEKEHDQAIHIKRGYLSRGASKEKAERIAWATISSLRKKKKRAGLGALRSM